MPEHSPPQALPPSTMELMLDRCMGVACLFVVVYWDHMVDVIDSVFSFFLFFL